MAGETLDIRGVPETMLQTLYARARESQKPNPVIYDDAAVQIVSRLHYDFTRAEKDTAMSTGVIARTIVLDRLTEDFLKSHPDAVVLNLGCGLDTRCCRMAGLYRRWYNLDLPEAMEIRRRFLGESYTVRQIARSAADERWTQEVKTGSSPVLVILEGLTMYLTPQQVQTIFAILRKHFPGATVFVEAMNPWVVKHIREKSIQGSHARFTWGVKNSKELLPLVPGFRAVRDVSLVEGMKVFAPVYRFLGKLPFVRNISNKILVLEC